MSFTAFMVSPAIFLARAEPSARMASMETGSRNNRFISAPIGPSLATERSTSADLNAENCALPNCASTLAREVPSSHSVDDEGAPLLDRQPSSIDLRAEVLARAELEVMTDAVAALGAKYPAVFWKRYGEGRTETEIAKELGISVAAVKTRAFRGRQAALRATAR